MDEETSRRLNMWIVKLCQMKLEYRCGLSESLSVPTWGHLKYMMASQPAADWTAGDNHSSSSLRHTK